MGSYIYVNDKPLTNSKECDAWFFGLYKKLYGIDLFQYGGEEKIVPREVLEKIDKILFRVVRRFNRWGNCGSPDLAKDAVEQRERLFKVYFRHLEPWWGPNCKVEWHFDAAWFITQVNYLYISLHYMLEKEKKMDLKLAWI
jgi:hypothetical protein